MCPSPRCFHIWDGRPTLNQNEDKIDISKCNTFISFHIWTSCLWLQLLEICSIVLQSYMNCSSWSFKLKGNVCIGFWFYLVNWRNPLWSICEEKWIEYFCRPGSKCSWNNRTLKRKYFIEKVKFLDYDL